MYLYSGLLRHHWAEFTEDWWEKKWKTGEMWCVLTVEHCTARGQSWTVGTVIAVMNTRNNIQQLSHYNTDTQVLCCTGLATDIKCFSVYSPFRVNRCNVYPGRGSERQRRRSSDDLVVRRPWPLPLAPWQRGQLQVARETSPAAAQVNTQRAGRGCERLAEAAVGGLSVVLEGGRIKEHSVCFFRVTERKRNENWEHWAKEEPDFYVQVITCLTNKGHHRLGID